jgi:ABC-2 type transport system permease protein
VAAVLHSVAFSLRRLVHNRRYLVFAVAMPVGFYLLYSHMYGGRLAFAGTHWGAYFMVSMASFGAIGTTLNVAGTQTALDREGGWTRMLRLTPLAPWAYVVGQLATAMVASLLVIALVLLVAVWTGETGVALAELWGCLAVWLGSLTFAALGLALAYLLDATTVGYGTTLVYLGTSFLGGLWTPLQVLPPAFGAIARWMPSFHMADMAWSLLAGRPVPAADLGALATYLVLFAGLAGYLYRRRG